MTNTTITASIMMVRLTASTSKSSFIIRFPQALRLLRLFKVEPSRSSFLLHHLTSSVRDQGVSLYCQTQDLDLKLSTILNRPFVRRLQHKIFLRPPPLNPRAPSFIFTFLINDFISDEQPPYPQSTLVCLGCTTAHRGNLKCDTGVRLQRVLGVKIENRLP